MLVAATDKGVCRLSFDEGDEELRARFPNAELVEGGADFAALLAARGRRGRDARRGARRSRSTCAAPPSRKRCGASCAGSRRARRAAMPQIAAAVGKPGAVRAAGSANGANNVAVLIPCHRVIRSRRHASAAMPTGSRSSANCCGASKGARTRCRPRGISRR